MTDKSGMREKVYIRPGFTLLELVIVVVIISVVASIAVSRFGDMSKRATAASAKGSRSAIQLKIDEHWAENGEFPPAIDPTWFADGKIPVNPYAQPAAARLVFISDTDNQHPGTKDALVTADGWWYNKRTGTVRIRVSAKTIAILIDRYNFINDAKVVAAGDLVDKP